MQIPDQGHELAEEPCNMLAGVAPIPTRGVQQQRNLRNEQMYCGGLPCSLVNSVSTKHVNSSSILTNENQKLECADPLGSTVLLRGRPDLLI
jgi:hypothetical protein